MSENVKELIAKASISSTSVRVGGTLLPEEAGSWLGLVLDETKGLMSKINTVRMRRLKKQIDLMELASEILVRVASGSEPSDGQKNAVSNPGKELQALSVQIFGEILKDTYQDNQDRPDFEDWVMKTFATVFGNDLVRLGWKGTTDTYAASFSTLAKGWLQVAKDAANTHKVNLNDGTDLRYATTADTEYTLTIMSAMIDAMPEKWNDADGLAFFMNPKHSRAYGRQLARSTSGAGAVLLKEQPVRYFEGVPIEAQAALPVDTYMLTPYKNLYLGVNTEVTLDMGWHRAKRCMEMVWDAAIDYQIGIDDACVVAYVY